MKSIFITLALFLFAWRAPDPGDSPDSANASHETNPSHETNASTGHQPHHRKPTPTAAKAEPGKIVDSIRVLCLYGSIPAKGWRGREPMYDRSHLHRETSLERPRQLLQ